MSEGVGEMVEGLSLPAERRSEIKLGRLRLGRLSSSPSREVIAIVKLTPPSRRRPLFTGAGQPREIIAIPSTSAGPCDPVFDS